MYLWVMLSELYLLWISRKARIRRALLLGDDATQPLTLILLASDLHVFGGCCCYSKSKMW
jgi:hypothetical protein